MDLRAVRVAVGGGYDVLIGRGLLPRCGLYIRAAVGDCRLSVVSDQNVATLYGDAVLSALAQAGYCASLYAFPAGESSKQIRTLGDVLESLAAQHLTRGDCVVALGGGVVGDLAGFAAGCYLRGVRSIQMPTTLLAAVDASVGGKTAIDLAAGKNMAGLFHQPALVLIDAEAFATLPAREFACGMAEAIKTGVLAGEDLFARIERGGDSDETDVIEACVAYKARIVEADERELGARKLLNLGHTVGHAIERLSDYREPHGMAVARGLAITTRAAARAGICDTQTAQRVVSTLARWGLPTDTAFSADALAEAALADKKRLGDTVTLALPRAIGDCILQAMPVRALADFWRKGL